MTRLTKVIRAHPFISICVGLIVFVFLLAVPLPIAWEQSQILGALVNSVHGPLFATLSFAVAWILDRQTPQGVAKIYLVMLIVAGLGEAGQVFTQRSVSLADLYNNLLGVTAGIALWVVAYRTQLALNKAGILACIGAGLLSIALLVIPPSITLLNLVDQQQRFPVIFDPQFRSISSLTESLGELDEVELNLTAKGLEVRLIAEQYPGVVFWKFPGDWQGYRSLEIIVENNSTDTLNLDIHVRDRGSHPTSKDRFGAFEIIQPGESKKLVFPLTTIATSPSNREMDLSKMSIISFARSHGNADGFIVHSIQLL